MKNNLIKLSLLLILFTAMLSCKKPFSTPAPKASDSFLPMQVGNLWYSNNQNYTEIKDSVVIGGKLYYQFYSLVGGDAIGISYLRIDETGKLIASDPKYPDLRVILADFGAKVGDKFFTTGQGNDTDKEVTVTEKTDTKMSFSYDAIYHPNLKGHPYLVSYIKGQGFPGTWTRLRINGIVLR
ncbi:hypothetical protein [Pedobacter rhodius]|uniref:Uncharacterized protein n=1 Tax=Pedobacter rhodius TaxID=3004098 RepID=A0ABT4KWF0_9SPHI|nr:hypothetical protein [Pedobacter sp. SJ11]MCZ4223268.1 hypothetical protein [Pedobacter sp. SJ11]